MTASVSDPSFWIGVFKIVLIDLALAGDNALVIALAVRTLPKRQQFVGRIWGTVGAVGLRLLFITIISYLLGIPLLQVVGGLLLIWIAIKLVRQSEEAGDGSAKAGTTLLEAIWIIIVADVVMSLDNVIGVIMVLAFVPAFAAILRVPFAILTPLIISICAVGAYSVNGRMLDIWYMLIFGVIGYVFKKLDYPLAPLVLALVLGDLAENALRQSLIMSQGSLLIFFVRPISGAITAVALLFFALPVITPWWRRLRGVPVPAASPRET